MTKINEDLARRSYENYSFSDYKAGSATSEYNAMVQEAKEKIEKAKENVSDEAKERLDSLLLRYETKLADWMNRKNRNGAGHVSQMLAGPANYNMRAHNKFVSREDKLWEEYKEIQDIDRKIHAIVAGDKIIKSDDKDALEKLREKLAKAQEEHEGYKAYNAKARKEGKEPLPSYVLSNSNGRMKNIKDRIAKLEKLAKLAEKTPQVELQVNEETGVRIIDNLEMQRIQIFFPDKPDSDCRNELKKNGFRWAPSVGAWQAYRGYGKVDKACEIVNKYY